MKFFLSRCEKGKFLQPVEISPELEKRLSDFSQRNIALTEILWKFKGTEKGSRKGNQGVSLGLWVEMGSGQLVQLDYVPI